jgi:hypothetical protein
VFLIAFASIELPDASDGQSLEHPRRQQRSHRVTRKIGAIVSVDLLASGCTSTAEYSWNGPG